MKDEKTNTSVLEESLIEYNDIKKMVEENSKNTITDIIRDTVKKELKDIITEGVEDEDDNGDGLDDITPDTGSETEIENENEPESSEEPEGETEMDADGEIDPEADGEEDFDIDQFKTGDDEYDLTNHSIEDVVKVFKKIDDNDSIIVKKLEDGKIEINDTENGAEYLIDLGEGEPETDVEDVNGDEGIFDEDVEIEIEGEPQSEDNDENEELTESEVEIELDGAEDMVDEKNMTQSISANRRAGHMTQTRIANAPGANNRDGAQLIKNESKKIAEEYNKKLKKIESAYQTKFKKINEEIEEYKNTLMLFRDKLKENAVLNNNLAKYVKIVTENATTKDEKLDILKRFSNEANTIEDGNKLYESIKNELNKKETPSLQIDKQYNVTTTPKQQVNEQIIYQSSDLKETIDLMNRINRL